MASFVTTVKFTQQGLNAIQETTKRSAGIKAAGKKMGVLGYTLTQSLTFATLMTYVSSSSFL